MHLEASETAMGDLQLHAVFAVAALDDVQLHEVVASSAQAYAKALHIEASEAALDDLQLHVVFASSHAVQAFAKAAHVPSSSAHDGSHDELQHYKEGSAPALVDFHGLYHAARNSYAPGCCCCSCK